MTTKNALMQPRIENLIDQLAEGLHEREHTVALTLLSMLAGQSIFLYGPPGTAKSLIACRVACAFHDAEHFEYLMQKFSTPEEVFGPIDINELKQGNYVRKSEGYLPTTHFAFLDEIWKSSPAILNTLLTIINERKFRNGATKVDVPLLGLIAASNETPGDRSLEALYDRFILRLMVNPMQERDNFESLLQGGAVSANITVSDDLQFSLQECKELKGEIAAVTLSNEVLAIIHAIRVGIDQHNQSQTTSDNKAGKSHLYVSDRRWQKVTDILKAAAFFCDRTQVMPIDTILLKHCLWSVPEEKPAINKIIDDAIEGFAAPNAAILAECKKYLQTLENMISQLGASDKPAKEDDLHLEQLKKERAALKREIKEWEGAINFGALARPGFAGFLSAANGSNTHELTTELEAIESKIKELQKNQKNTQQE